MTEEAELPLLSFPRVPYIYVDTDQALLESIRDLEQGEGFFAIDAERASGFKYSQRAYLIQIYRSGSKIFLIDPIAVSAVALTELSRLLRSDGWYLHAATQDLPCLAELGLKPEKLFDTELVARLLGFPRVGLGAVCELALGLRLAKEHSAADWSTRPIPQSWLDYAALDVDVLPEIAKFLEAEVEASGKTELVSQEMEHLLGFTPKPEKQDRWRGLSGIQNVKDAQGLAIARELWNARNELAQAKDVSPGRLIRDLSITHVAVSRPASKSAMIGDKGFNGQAARTYLDKWWAAYSKGLTSRDLPPLRLPATGIPNHRNWAAKFPEADARLQRAKIVIAEVARQLNLPVENLLTPDYLRAVCFEPAGFTVDRVRNQLENLGARTWQLDAVAEKLTAALQPQPEASDPQVS